MSGAIKGVKKWVKFVADPFKLSDKSKPKKPAPVQEDTSLTDAEMSVLADEEAKRKAKIKAKGTQTVLTSPLGATTTAKTAITKLGG